MIKGIFTYFGYELPMKNRVKLKPSLSNDKIQRKFPSR